MYMIWSTKNKPFRDCSLWYRGCYAIGWAIEGCPGKGILDNPHIIYGMSSFPLTNSIIFQDGYCTTSQSWYLRYLADWSWDVAGPRSPPVDQEFGAPKLYTWLPGRRIIPRKPGLVNIQKASKSYWSHGPVEIVDLPISMVIFPSVFCMFARPGSKSKWLVTRGLPQVVWVSCGGLSHRWTNYGYHGESVVQGGAPQTLCLLVYKPHEYIWIL